MIGPSEQTTFPLLPLMLPTGSALASLIGLGAASTGIAAGSAAFSMAASVAPALIPSLMLNYQDIHSILNENYADEDKETTIKEEEADEFPLDDVLEELVESLEEESPSSESESDESEDESDNTAKPPLGTALNENYVLRSYPVLKQQYKNYMFNLLNKTHKLPTSKPINKARFTRRRYPQLAKRLANWEDLL